MKFSIQFGETLKVNDETVPEYLQQALFGYLKEKFEPKPKQVEKTAFLSSISAPFVEGCVVHALGSKTPDVASR